MGPQALVKDTEFHLQLRFNTDRPTVTIKVPTGVMLMRDSEVPERGATRLSSKVWSWRGRAGPPNQHSEKKAVVQMKK